MDYFQRSLLSWNFVLFNYCCTIDIPGGSHLPYWCKMRSNVLKRLNLQKLFIKLNERIPIKCTVEVYCYLSESSDNDETTPLLPHPLPPVFHYDRYREPLIGTSSN